MACSIYTEINKCINTYIHFQHTVQRPLEDSNINIIYNTCNAGFPLTFTMYISLYTES